MTEGFANSLMIFFFLSFPSYPTLQAESEFSLVIIHLQSQFPYISVFKEIGLDSSGWPQSHKLTSPEHWHCISVPLPEISGTWKRMETSQQTESQNVRKLWGITRSSFLKDKQLSPYHWILQFPGQCATPRCTSKPHPYLATFRLPVFGQVTQPFLSWLFVNLIKVRVL